MPNFERQTASIVQIKDILHSTYVKESSELTPNYILVGSKRISRVNLMAVVVDTSDMQSYKSITLDDGTGTITVRTFEDTKILDKVHIGDSILIIAKPREFNSEKYLIQEIIKKILNHKWIEVRKRELALPRHVPPDEVIAETVQEAVELLPAEKIIHAIRASDPGDGADVEKVIAQAHVTDAEKIVHTLLSQGDVFEVKPGKLKVLE